MPPEQPSVLHTQVSTWLVKRFALQESPPSTIVDQCIINQQEGLRALFGYFGKKLQESKIKNVHVPALRQHINSTHIAITNAITEPIKIPSQEMMSHESLRPASIKEYPNPQPSDQYLAERILPLTINHFFDSFKKQGILAFEQLGKIPGAFKNAEDIPHWNAMIEKLQTEWKIWQQNGLKDIELFNNLAKFLTEKWLYSRGYIIQSKAMGGTSEKTSCWMEISKICSIETYTTNERPLHVHQLEAIFPRVDQGLCTHEYNAVDDTIYFYVNEHAKRVEKAYLVGTQGQRVRIAHPQGAEAARTERNYLEELWNSFCSHAKLEHGLKIHTLCEEIRHALDYRLTGTISGTADIQSLHHMAKSMMDAASPLHETLFAQKSSLNLFELRCISFALFEMAAQATQIIQGIHTRIGLANLKLLITHASHRCEGQILRNSIHQGLDDEHSFGAKMNAWLMGNQIGIYTTPFSLDVPYSHDDLLSVVAHAQGMQSSDLRILMKTITETHFRLPMDAPPFAKITENGTLLARTYDQ